MNKTSAELKTRRLKTWSTLGNLGRAPNEYEIVTHGLNHTTRSEVPLEMGANVWGNKWLIKYRDASPIKVADWNAFRDPDRITYHLYNQRQNDAESYIDNLLVEYTERENVDGRLSAEALSFLLHCYGPTRYLSHGLQMVSAYIQQLASSSFVENCATFQTADQLRRVQRVAYRVCQLSRQHGSVGFGSKDRSIWEGKTQWQPIREGVEKLLCTYAWDEAFIALNLMLKPVIDEISLVEFANVCREYGHELDALISLNLYEDSKRSQRWSIALAKFMWGDSQENVEAAKKHVAKWMPIAEQIIISGSNLIGEYSKDSSTILKIENRARNELDSVLGAAGLA